jgi:hypothetical protein
VALIVSTVSPAAAQQPRRVFGEQTHAFRAILNEVGLKPTRDRAALADRPGQTILVVLGRTNDLDQLLTRELTRFVQAGGAALVATDRATNIPWPLNYGVAGQYVSAEPDQSYRGELRECPLLVEEPSAGGRHALFAGLPEPPTVVTNRPSFLARWGPLPTVARLPTQGFRTIGKMRIFPEQLHFAAAGDWGDGRLLVMADHSVFINDMMLQADNDNIAFAFNVARWLSDNGKRTEVLFYEDGAVQTDFNVSLDFTPPIPPVEALVPLFNQVLVEMERENIFNKTLLQLVPHRALMRTLLLLLTVGLLVVGVYRFLNAKFRTDLRPAAAPAAAAPAVPQLERRHQALLARGNVAEAARELAYQSLAELGPAPEPGAPPPRVEVAGSWWERVVWVRRVRRLWALAAGGAGRVTPAALKALPAALRELHDAAAAGKVRLAGAKND